MECEEVSVVCSVICLVPPAGEILAPSRNGLRAAFSQYLMF